MQYHDWTGVSYPLVSGDNCPDCDYGVLVFRTKGENFVMYCEECGAIFYRERKQHKGAKRG